jgi:hypothetical protein
MVILITHKLFKGRYDYVEDIGKCEFNKLEMIPIFANDGKYNEINILHVLKLRFRIFYFFLKGFSVHFVAQRLFLITREMTYMFTHLEKCVQ